MTDVVTATSPGSSGCERIRSTVSPSKAATDSQPAPSLSERKTRSPAAAYQVLGWKASRRERLGVLGRRVVDEHADRVDEAHAGLLEHHVEHV